MWPLGQYDRLVHEIKRREDNSIPVTFGLLIADYNQQTCREYILNYIDRFNYKSGRYINFYLPGYLEENFYHSNNKIIIKDKKYYFNREIYLEFLDKLEKDFSIDYPYNPVLILFEYDQGHFSKTKRVVIELDSNGSGIKKVGEIFEKIFELAKTNVNIRDFSKALQKSSLREGMLDKIIEGIDNSILTVVHNQTKNLRKYSLK
ncbi:hypothetical protein J14TS5_22700 [Paenibacillus lautus]|uniref:hypothetical protein n=1 Tax=Paenibacillus lautus TaxID=1401 RepID=UPI001B2F4076|nr:hypothetical protein [Paenibacillus lautus]GIO97184.1 hypothetical protein J14TS5_22700 [Paenibacillus lautus]